MDQHEVEAPGIRGTVVAIMVMVAAAALAVAAIGFGKTAADAEAEQWRACIASTQAAEFSPTGGADAWCVTTTR